MVVFLSTFNSDGHPASGVDVADRSTHFVREVENVFGLDLTGDALCAPGAESFADRYPELVGPTVLHVLEDTDSVHLSFLAEESESRSCLAYYVYDTRDGPPAEPEYVVVFPHAAAVDGDRRVLQPGARVRLRSVVETDPAREVLCGSQAYRVATDAPAPEHWRFRAGTSIGVALLRNGFAVLSGNQSLGTLETLAASARGLLLAATTRPGTVLVGIEEGDGDVDSNDCVCMVECDLARVGLPGLPAGGAPQALAAAAASQLQCGTLCFEDRFHEHASPSSFGDFNDVVIRYYVTPALAADGRVTSLLVTFAVMATCADDSHALAVELPSVQHMPHSAWCETFATATGRRATQEVIRTSDKLWLTLNDKSLMVTPDHPAFLRLRVVFETPVDPLFYHTACLPVWLKNNVTGSTFRSDTLYRPPGKVGYSARMQCVRLRGVVTWSPPVENGEITAVYPSARPFLTHAGATDIAWCRRPAPNMPVLQLPDPARVWDHGAHPYFCHFSDLAVLPPEIQQPIVAFQSPLCLVLRGGGTGRLAGIFYTLPKQGRSLHNTGELAFFVEADPATGVFFRNGAWVLVFADYQHTPPVTTTVQLDFGDDPVRPTLGLTRDSSGGTLTAAWSWPGQVPTGARDVRYSAPGSVTAAWQGRYCVRSGLILYNGRAAVAIGQVFYDRIDNAQTGDRAVIIWSATLLKWVPVLVRGDSQVVRVEPDYAVGGTYMAAELPLA